MSTQEISNIFAQIANNSITKVDLRGKKLRGSDVKELARRIRVNKSVTTIDLCSNFIGDDGARALADALKLNQILTEFKVDGFSRNIQIGNETFGQLIDRIIIRNKDHEYDDSDEKKESPTALIASPNTHEPVLLNCNVCLEPFHHSDAPHQPRLLPCCHSFCTSDCEKLIQLNSIQCPTCRFQTSVASIQDLKLNYALIELLEYIDQHPHLQSTSSVQHPCTFPNCSQSAVCHCFNDEEDLCDSHRQLMHTTEAHKKHKIVPIQDKMKHLLSKPKICTLHHLPMALWCAACHSLCCPTCSSHGAHKGHDTMLVEDVASEQRKSLQAIYDNYEGVSNRLEVESKRLLDVKTSIEQSAEFLQLQITHQFDQAVQLLQQRKQHLLHELQVSIVVAKKELELRMMDLSGCRSHWSSFSRQTLLSLDTPDFEFLSHITAINQSAASFQHTVQGYDQQCRTTPITTQFSVEAVEALEGEQIKQFVKAIGIIKTNRELKIFRSEESDIFRTRTSGVVSLFIWTCDPSSFFNTSYDNITTQSNHVHAFHHKDAINKLKTEHKLDYEVVKFYVTNKWVTSITNSPRSFFVVVGEKVYYITSDGNISESSFSEFEKTIKKGLTNVFQFSQEDLNINGRVLFTTRVPQNAVDMFIQSQRLKYHKMVHSPNNKAVWSYNFANELLTFLKGEKFEIPVCMRPEKSMESALKESNEKSD